MKLFHSRLFASIRGYFFLLSAFCSLLCCSCVKDSATGKNIPDIARIAGIMGEAAQVGTTLDLQARPGDAVYFQAAHDALGSMIQAKDYDPAHFTAALQKLPIKTLSGPNGSIYVSLGVVAWDELSQEATKLDSQAWVGPVLSAVYAGMSRALGYAQ